MTNLAKGVLVIDGYAITKDTTSDDIKNHLKDSYNFCAVARDGTGELFRFDRVCLLNKAFKIKVTFINKKLKNIVLFSLDDTCLTYEERFEADCDWLVSILGEPASKADSGNFYYYEGICIYSFIQRDLSRNPAETFICCKYDR